MQTGSPTEQSATRALLVIAVAATVLRAVAAWLTIDRPGDGVTRALYAYRWSQSPELIRSGIWLPGFNYLAGALCMVIPDPMIAPRLVNVILGSASVPLLYAVTRRIHGSTEALAAAALLAVLPLHVGLSASSLTEAGFVFGMLAVLWSALGAAEKHAPGSNLRLALVVVFGVFVEMFRYEAWVLLPIVVAYVAHRRRSPLVAVGLTAALLCFPLQWSLGNHARSGDPLLGFTAATTDVNTMDPVPPFTAARLLWQGVCNQLGPAAVVLLLFGVLDAAVRVARRTAGPERVVHLGLVATAWAILLALALRMGTNLWGRYLVLGIVLALPLATAWMQRFTLGRRLPAAIAAACVLSSFAFAYVRYSPGLYVTRHRPLEILELTEWVAASTYRDDALVFTWLGWRASYAKLYSPALSDRFLVVSNYTSDEGIQHFIRSMHPALLITRPGDADQRARVERQLGATVGPQHLVKTIRELLIFDIRHLR